MSAEAVPQPEREAPQQADLRVVFSGAEAAEKDHLSVVTEQAPDMPSAVESESGVDLSGTGIKRDANGRGHRDHGKFISKKQLEQIEANADLIRSDQQGTREEYEAREAKRRAEVDKDIDAKARKIAFKSGFGSRALERTDGLQAMIDKEATAQAASEGQDVAYREKADEEVTMPEGFKAEAWDIMDDDMRRTAVEEWSNMSDDEKSEAFKGEFDFSKPVAEMDAKTREAYFANVKEVAELQASEPVTSLEPASLQSRVKRLFGKASKKLTEVYTTVGNKMINPFDKELTETQQKRRKVLLGAGIGAVAAYGLYARLHGMEHSAGVTPEPQQVHPGTELHPKLDTVTIHPGDSYWKAEEIRHPHASEAQIHHFVERDLAVDNRTWEDARHLTPGDKMTVSHKK